MFRPVIAFDILPATLYRATGASEKKKLRLRTPVRTVAAKTVAPVTATEDDACLAWAASAALRAVGEIISAGAGEAAETAPAETAPAGPGTALAE